jgi:hypothetical protein
MDVDAVATSCWLFAAVIGGVMFVLGVIVANLFTTFLRKH